MVGFETETQHLSPTPSHGDGAPQARFTLGLPNSSPNLPVDLAQLDFILMSERNAVPSSFPGALWIIRGVGCTCPAHLARLLAAGPAFPQGNAGAGPWGWTWGDEIHLQGSCTEQLRGCSTGEKGVLAEGAHPEPQLWAGELAEGTNPCLAGLETAKPTIPLCPISQTAP